MRACQENGPRVGISKQQQILNILKILFCIGEAFKCLRKNRIVHRDVKPAILFMTKKNVTM